MFTMASTSPLSTTTHDIDSVVVCSAELDSVVVQASQLVHYPSLPPGWSTWMSAGRNLGMLNAVSEGKPPQR